MHSYVQIYVQENQALGLRGLTCETVRAPLGVPG